MSDTPQILKNSKRILTNPLLAGWWRNCSWPRNCSQCEGAREYTFTSRGRDNVVNCVRCEPVYKLLEIFEPILELIRGDSPY